jgi:RHS repeat-associated protein
VTITYACPPWRPSTTPSPDPAVPLPNKVARLNGYQRVAEGPGKSLHVMPGDRVRVEVFVKYLNLRQDQGIGAAALLNYLLAGATGFTQVPIDGSTFKITQSSTGLSAIIGGTGDGGTAPQAYLNAYWLNESGDLASAQHKNAPVTKAAAITPTTVTAAHERLFFEWVIDKPGDLYINVSHDAPENIDVYFDDLHIEHLYSPIVAGSDFYPFGLEMADRHLTREKYRYGYQGKYAERDDETGWEHFELREYDPVIGRWTAMYPYGQFYSPYVGMGNNPVSGTDPDGGFDWFLNNSTGEVKQYAGETSKEGWTSIAGDNATNQDIRDGLQRLVGFYNTTFDQGREFLDFSAAENFQKWQSWSMAIGAAMLYYNPVPKDLAGNTVKAVQVAKAAQGLTTVGRWMSKAEYAMMLKTGRMVEGAGGQTFVAKGGSTVFSAAAEGSVYIEFQVSTRSLLQGGRPNWFKTIGPGASESMKAALQKQGGQLLPNVKNISPILNIKVK